MELSLDQIVGIVTVIGSILISMTLHEAMHAFTSNWLGDDTAAKLGRLTLNPIKHIDPLTTILLPIAMYLLTGIPFGAAKPVPFNPARVRHGEYGAAMVGAAGPLMNLFLAAVSGLWVRFVIGFEAGIVTEVMLLFMIVNLSFAIFNLIPFPPLDGSRVLYAIAPQPLRELMSRIESGGLASIGIFVIFIYQFIAPLIGAIIEFLAEAILGSQLFI